MLPILPVVHRANLTFDEFYHDFAMRGVPVVLDVSIGITVSDIEDSWLRSAGSPVSIAQLLARLNGARDTKGRPAYVRDRVLFDWPLPEHCPEVLQNFTVPKYFVQDFVRRAPAGSLYQGSWPSLFIQPAGSRSGLHVDAFGSNFWQALITGRKKWRFFRRSDLPFLYPARLGSTPGAEPEPEPDPEAASSEPSPVAESLLVPPDHTTRANLRRSMRLGRTPAVPVSAVSGARPLLVDTFAFDAAVAAHETHGKTPHLSEPAPAPAGLSRDLLARFPLLAHAQMWEVEVRPGQAIFVPAGTPHQVFNIEDSIALSSNYIDGSNLALARAVLSEMYAQDLSPDAWPLWKLLNSLLGPASAMDLDPRDTRWPDL